MKELPRRRLRQIWWILTHFYYGVTESARARAELEPIKKIKNKSDVSLYFLLRVCVPSAFTLQGRWTLDPLIRPHSPLTGVFDPPISSIFTFDWSFSFDPASEFFWTFLPPEVTTWPFFDLSWMSGIPWKKKIIRKVPPSVLLKAFLALHCYHPEVAWPSLDKNWP